MRTTNPRFIIEIIVKARNEIAAVMQKSAAEIDKVTHAHEHGTKAEKQRVDATKATAKAAEDASKRFEAYTKSLEGGNRETRTSIQQLRAFKQEFNRLGNASKSGSEVADSMYLMSQQAETLAKRIEDGAKRAAEARAKEAAQAKSAAQEISQAHTQAIREDEKRTSAVEKATAARMTARRQEAEALMRDVRGELAADDQRAKQFDTNLARVDKAERRRLATIQQGRDAVIEAQKAEAAAHDAATKAEAAGIATRIEQQRLVRSEISKTVREMKNARTEAERDVSNRKLVGQAQDLRDLGMTAREVQGVLKRAYSDQDVDRAITRRQAKIRDLSAEVHRLQNLPPARQGFFARLLGIGGGDVEAINKELQSFEKRITSNSFSASRFAGNLRAVVIVGLIGFFQQLVGVGVALGGTLVSLASAAIQAGAALGGAFVAGAAQALPVMGLLAAAWGRVGAVFKAVQQAIKARQASAYDAATQADRERSAADSIRSAQEALANAQRQATTAQENLTKARADAVRQIQDLVFAERQAQLQAESARLAQEDAQRSLRRSLATGNVDQLASQSLQARQTNLDVLTSGVGAARATFDATKATRGGVEGMDNVVQARRAVADAARGIADASRQLNEARIQAGEAIKQMGTADRLLKQMLSDLSPAERRLYKVLYQLEKDYRSAFTGPGGILESITDAFTYGAEQIDKLLHNRRFIGAAKSLADGIGAQLHRIFSGFTSPHAIRFFEDMAKEAKRNLPVVVDILSHLGGLFTHIARAASPAFHAFLTFLDDVTGRADKATGSRSGLSKLGKFFDKGEKYAESILKMTYALARLFGAIMGAGAAEAGGNAFDSITRSLNKATDWINHHRGDVHKFFQEAIQATGSVMKVIGAVAKALFGMFHKKQVEEFADAFRMTLLPALENILTVMGLIAGIFLKIASNPIGSALAQLLITSVGLRVVLGPIVKLFGNLVVWIGQIFGRLGVVKSGLRVLEFAGGPLKVFSAIAAVLLVLTGRIHSFGDAVKVLTPIIATLAATMAFSRIGGLGAGLSKLGALLKGEGGFLNVGGFKRAGAKATTNVAEKGFVDLTSVGTKAEGEVAKEGSKLGGFLSTGMKAAIKKAGWIGVGVSAVEGIMSGFKHHSALAGLQDFMHSVSFGLFDSFEESARKAANRMAKTIHDRLARPGVIPTINPNAPADSSRPRGRPRRLTLDDILGPRRETVALPPAGYGSGRGAPNAAAIRAAQGGQPPTTGRDTQVGEDIQKLREKYGKSLDKFLNGLRDRVNTFRDLMARQDVTGIQNWIKNIQEFAKTAPPEFQGVLDGLVVSAQKATAGISEAFRKVVGDVNGNWKLLATQSKVHLKDIRDHVTANMGVIKLRLGADSEEGRKAMAKNFQKAADAVQKAMDDGTISTRTGTREIRRLMVKSLTALGLTEEQATNKLDHGTIAQTGDLAAGVPRMPGATGGYASPGGFLKGVGHRGRDAIRAVLAPGEAVLNWAHQRLVEPAMRSMYGFGLDGLFKRTDARHGAEGMGGMAAGGFVAQPGTDFSEGNEPKIAAALRKLGNLLRTTIYGISGYRSPQHSVRVGGFPNDPHTRGDAADIGVGSASRASAGSLTDAMLKRVGLYRPFYPADPNEINHVQLIGGKVGEIITSAVDSAYQAFKGPHLEGRGGIVAIINRGFHQITRAANQRGRAIARAMGFDDGSFSTNAKGTGRGLMQRIADERGWSFGDWWKVDARETGHGANETNPHSSARLRGQFLSMNYGKYGPGSDPNANPSMRQQIISMARYIASRYGNPTKAWAHEQSAGWYERGGSVPGSGPFAAVLHGGEHVWTAAEVMRAGGHQVMHAMRRILGGGGQGSPGRGYAAGGAPRAYAEPTIHDINAEGIIGQIGVAQHFIDALRGSIVNKKFTDAFSKSVQALIGKDGLLDQMDTAVTALSDKLALSLKRATYRITKSGDVVRRLGDVGVADRTVENLRTVYSALNTEQHQIENSLADTAKKLKQGGLTATQRAYLVGLQRNLRQRLTTVQQSIADNVESQYSAVEEQISTRTDRATTRANRRSAGIGIIERLRTRMGGTALSAMGVNPSDLASMRVGNINAQIGDLQKAADFAGRHGHKKAQQDILDQIADLRVQALEAVAQGIQDDADEIDRQAGRANTVQDLRGRLADLMDAAGNKQGAFATRGNILQQRAGILTNQIGGLQGLAAQAAASGNTALAEKLNDEIADLNVQLAENTDAQKENTIAARQAAIDAITNRQGFQGGVFGSLQTLLQGLGTAMGTDTTGQQAGLLKQGLSLLQDTGGKLADKLLANYGIDVRGQGPQDLAKALSSLNYDGIETNMSDSDRSQFEGLINSIIENATAVQANTEQLNQISTPTSQNWSSTAWQWFRNPIFNGAGGLLPQYPVPSLASGASILSDGMVHVHAGEQVVAANVARGGSGGEEVFAPHVENHEQTVDMDADAMANRLYFLWRNRPRG